jgi:hypothetical protein
MFRVRTVLVGSRMDSSTITSPRPRVIKPSRLVPATLIVPKACDRRPRQERAEQDRAATEEHDDRTGLAGGSRHRLDEIATLRGRRFWEGRHPADCALARLQCRIKTTGLSVHHPRSSSADTALERPLARHRCKPALKSELEGGRVLTFRDLEDDELRVHLRGRSARFHRGSAQLQSQATCRTVWRR